MNSNKLTFCCTAAVQDIVHERLEKEGLEKIHLPLGVSPTEPHVPIFASNDVKTKSRVVVIFGDTTEMLGVLAMRVANGHGGIDKGSLVSVVREIKGQRCSPDDTTSPGIIIANPAELWWWPEGKRPLEIVRRGRAPMETAVHTQRLHDDRLNAIPANKDAASHTEYMFKHVLPHLARKDVKIDVVAIGHACDPLENFLGHQENWEEHAACRLNALVLLGGYWRLGGDHGEGFKKFLETARFSLQAWLPFRCAENCVNILPTTSAPELTLPTTHQSTLLSRPARETPSIRHSRHSAVPSTALAPANRTLS